MAISDCKKAIANPTKAFFVRMITRDISLEDCILDLIDNSVDSAWRSEGNRPMGLADGADLSPYHISIKASPDGFSIEDNCGGMSLDDAVSHAFSFGRPTDEAHDDYSIGVYGIGMKRAVFKIGRDIRVESTYKEGSGDLLSFCVPIDVEEWMANDSPPWDFDIEDSTPLPEEGVKISISRLNDGALDAFESPAFLQNLRRVISRDYTLHLSRGLKIELNGEPIIGWRIELRSSEEFSPLRMEYQDQDISVEIFAGMSAPPPDTTEPDEDDEGDKRHGWYVVCNGRIVLAADKTSVSGWGTDAWPQWHRQYSGFIGIILFTAANAADLPLTTTKRSVDASSEVFRRARPRMREVTREWIDYTNARKQALEEAKTKEAAATPVLIQDVPKQSAVRLPVLVAKPPSVQVANVNYSVRLDRLKKLAKEMGNINLPYREVGIRSFEYTYADMVGED